jgi:hypothetical protein
VLSGFLEDGDVHHAFGDRRSRETPPSESGSPSSATGVA